MKTTGIVTRLVAASSVLVAPFSGAVSLSGDAWAMIGIGAILLTYRLVRKHQALYPMTVARSGLALRTRQQIMAAAASPSALSNL